ncbi:hypothetical protein L2E82_50859 [Cichorium intybus]|nr:hypothetical protein L2E82_50859 [Cichorium intybus]
MPSVTLTNRRIPRSRLHHSSIVSSSLSISILDTHDHPHCYIGVQPPTSPPSTSHHILHRLCPPPQNQTPHPSLPASAIFGQLGTIIHHRNTSSTPQIPLSLASSLPPTPPIRKRGFHRSFPHSIYSSSGKPNWMSPRRLPFLYIFSLGDTFSDSSPSDVLVGTYPFYYPF